MLPLPKEPMAPILNEQIPQGPEWGYQLKWDGVRLLASVDNDGVALFSRRMRSKTDTYPEIARTLASVDVPCLLDGEAVYFDPQTARPNFAKILQRERLVSSSAIRQKSLSEPVCYVLFDILHHKDRDIRSWPYEERHHLLKSLFPQPTSSLFVTDLFTDGAALWRWIEENRWEGMVSKRLSSPYREGKKHRDWFKKKTIQWYEVFVTGITVKSGRLSSLVMAKDGNYFGKVSVGLNERQKKAIFAYAQTHAAGQSPFRPLPADLKKDAVLWLSRPFLCRVTGLETTESGVLRHPQIATLPDDLQ